jgi:GxxExxY protein
VRVLHEPDSRTDALAREVIDAAIEVHRHLRPGFLAKVYEEALCVELRLRKIPFERQRPAKVEDKGEYVGEGQLDLLVDERLIVELKRCARSRRFTERSSCPTSRPQRRAWHS